MDRLSLSELSTFLSIARHLNFRRAADELRVSPSALSHALKTMEARLGLRLVNRTTRSVALTDAGGRLFEKLGPAFAQIDDAMLDLDAFRVKPSGTLRLNAGVQGARLMLLPLIADFVRAYPEIDVELVADDSLADLVSDRFDAGVRFGERLHDDMIAVPLGPQVRSVVVGTKAFLDLQGRPDTPRVLNSMSCVGYRFPTGHLYRWDFAKGEERFEVDISGPLTVNSMDLVLDAVLKDMGLGFVFEPMVSKLISAGRLEVVLDDWCAYYPGFYLYYTTRKQMPSALRAFIDFALIAKKVPIHQP